MARQVLKAKEEEGGREEEEEEEEEASPEEGKEERKRGKRSSRVTGLPDCTPAGNALFRSFNSVKIHGFMRTALAFA